MYATSFSSSCTSSPVTVVIGRVHVPVALIGVVFPTPIDLVSKLVGLKLARRWWLTTCIRLEQESRPHMLAKSIRWCVANAMVAQENVGLGLGVDSVMLAVDRASKTSLSPNRFGIAFRAGSVLHLLT